MFIIDTHAHIFPTKIALKATGSIGEFYNIPMQGNGEIDDLLALGSSAGVNGYIVNSTATTKQQVRAINNFIANSIEDKENVWGLATLHPGLSDAEIAYEMDFALKNGLIGIKLHPDFQKFYIDDPSVFKLYEAAAGVLPILFHTGDSRYDYSSPRRLAKIAKEFKDLKCIGAHFGGYCRWEEVDCYRGLENVFFDTSSSLYKLEKEQSLHIIQMLGVDKFMFGVDYPMWKPDFEIQNILNLDLNINDTEKIFYKNAENFYNLTICEKK